MLLLMSEHVLLVVLQLILLLVVEHLIELKTSQIRVVAQIVRVQIRGWIDAKVGERVGVGRGRVHVSGVDGDGCGGCHGRCCLAGRIWRALVQALLNELRQRWPRVILKLGRGGGRRWLRLLIF